MKIPRNPDDLQRYYVWRKMCILRVSLKSCAATRVAAYLTRPLLLSDFNHTQDVVTDFKKTSLYSVS